MKRARRVATLAAAAAVAIAITGCAGSSGGSGETSGSETGGSKEPIRIGAVLSLSGTYSGLGTPEKNTIEMEVARINEGGGIEGRDIEVVYVDDATDPAKAQASVSKLVDQDGVVAIIGATGTGQSMAMRGDIERAQVAQVSVAGGTVITDQFSKWVFQTPWSNRIVVPFTLKQFQKAGVKNVALVSDSGGYGKDGREVATKALKDAGIAVVADEAFNPGDSDMTPQLTKIKAAKPDAVWLWSAGKEAATVAKGYVELRVVDAGNPGTAAGLYGAPGNARKEFITGAGPSSEGFTFAAGKILVPEAYGKDSEEYEVATDFVERYKAEYGSEPDIFAGHAYDAIGLIADAAKRVEGDITPEALRDALEETQDFVGIGGTFTFSATDHNGMTEDDLVVYGIEGGKWVLSK